MIINNIVIAIKSILHNNILQYEESISTISKHINKNKINPN